MTLNDLLCLFQYLRTNSTVQVSAQCTWIQEPPRPEFPAGRGPSSVPAHPQLSLRQSHTAVLGKKSQPHTQRRVCILQGSNSDVRGSSSRKIQWDPKEDPGTSLTLHPASEASHLARSKAQKEPQLSSLLQCAKLELPSSPPMLSFTPRQSSLVSGCQLCLHGPGHP